MGAGREVRGGKTGVIELIRLAQKQGEAVVDRLQLAAMVIDDRPADRRKAAGSGPAASRHRLANGADVGCECAAYWPPPA